MKPEQKPNPFPTTFDWEKHIGPHFKEPDPKPNRKSEMGRFWFMCVPLGFIAGLVGGVVAQSGAVVLPIWAITALILSSIGGGKQSR